LLICRDKDIFLGSFTSSFLRDEKLVEEFFGRSRTEIIRAEDFFRSIALPYASRYNGSGDPHDAYRGDILDVLWQVQPKLSFEIRQIDNETLRPVAERLSSGRCPLECYFVPKGELIRLANLCIRMLNATTGKDGTRPSELERRLRRVSNAIAAIPRENLSFVDIQETGRALVSFCCLCFSKLLSSSLTRLF